jgi:putative ABC transport system ATP-binding protein
LAGDPQIVLADEPTAALDSQTGRTVMEMMTRLAHERDRAVVIVTHDSRVLSFADRILRIEDGRIADSSLAKKHPESDVSPELLTPSALHVGGIHIA